MNVKIYASHRIDLESYIVSSDIITPMLCGATFNEKVSSINGDNTGDNISEKRSYLGEFTVEYWMWKNIKADYYGLCHYRRYFSFSDKKFYRNSDNHIQALFLDRNAVKKYELDNDDKIKSLCSQYEIIIPEPTDVTKIIPADINIKFNTVKDVWQYKYGKDLPDDMIDIFVDSLEKYDFPLIDDLKEYLDTRYHIGYNCFIVKKEIFNDMCEIIFNTIFKFELEYGATINYNAYPRTLGYLCELMFGVFMYKAKQHKKYKELPLVFFNETKNTIPYSIKIKAYIHEYTKRILKKYLKANMYNKLKVVYKKIKR